MKNKFIIPPIAGLFSTILIISSLVANPFSCKIPKTAKSKKEINLEDLSYKGYALLDNQHFALIQIGKQQYALKTGDKVKSIKILKITANHLDYQYNKAIYTIKLNPKD